MNIIEKVIVTLIFNPIDKLYNAFEYATCKNCSLRRNQICEYHKRYDK